MQFTQTCGRVRKYSLQYFQSFDSTRLSRLQLSCQDLLPLFEKYGDVGDIYLPIERGSGRSRGFAFVRYYDKRDAEVSVQCLLCLITWPKTFLDYDLSYSQS